MNAVKSENKQQEKRKTSFKPQKRREVPCMYVLWPIPLLLFFDSHNIRRA